MESSIDFGELSQDENFKKKVLDLEKNINAAGDIMEKFLSTINYNELSLEDKVRYDLLLAFSINTFYWIYLRVNGVDPNTHDIKHQINRVREYMSRSKKIYEKKTLMPRLDQGAAKRFVRSGLWTPKSEGQSDSSELTEEKVNSRKRKRQEDDDDDVDGDSIEADEANKSTE